MLNVLNFPTPNQSKNKDKVVVYGFGQAGKDTVAIKSKAVDILAICNTFAIEYKEYHGIPIITPDELARFSFDKIIIASVYIDEIRETLTHFHIPNDKIEVYEPPKILIDKRFFDAKKLINTLSNNSTKVTSGHLTKTVESLLSKPSNTLSYKEWLLIYDFLIVSKAFPLALQCRQKSIQALLQLNPRELNNEMLCEYLLALFDTNELEQLKTLLAKNKVRLSKDDKSYFTLLLNFAHGKAQYTKYNYDQKCSVSNDFTKLIKNKEVAIIGPCLNNLEQGKEIDSHDIVIRFLPSLSGGLDVSMAGSKTDIVYVSAHKLQTMKSENSTLLKLPNVIYVLEPTFNGEKLNLTNNQRLITYAGKMKLFHSFGNFILRILIDIVQASPKKITAFNFDLFTSPTPYVPSYLTFLDSDKNANIGENLLVNQAVFHDFASQHNFLKILKKSGSLHCDKILSQLLELSSEDYYSRLQTAFNKNGF